MSIRIDQIRIDPRPDVWLEPPVNGMDVTLDDLWANDLLAMVRHILRDERCDQIPVVLAAVWHPLNQYGHDFQVEVEYSRSGYRAIYAALLTPEGLANVQCYMD